MKKVSVQFNLVVDDDVSHKSIKALILHWLHDVECFGKITSIQINDIQKKG